MGKTKSQTSSKSTTKSSTSGRPQPMAPKAGFTMIRSRYGCGGKVKK